MNIFACFALLETKHTQLYFRLIALWAICEGTLGGIIHGLQLPISGLFIGGSAILIICTIGFYYPHKGAILKATLYVAIFKFMLSPHSPIPAYVAVFFQGLLGEFFFTFIYKKKSASILFKSCCIAFSSIALFESGVQRILTTTIIYGVDFWKAINDFIIGITGQESVTNYSYYIASGYILIHLIVGIWIGFIAAKIPFQVNIWEKQIPPLDRNQEFNEEFQVKNKRESIWKKSFVVVWIVFILVFIQSEFHIGKSILSSSIVSHILVRSFIILFIWWFIFSPLLLYFLKKWLQKEKEALDPVIQQILGLLPSMQNIVRRSWEYASKYKRLKRIKLFIKTIFVYAIKYE